MSRLPTPVARWVSRGTRVALSTDEVWYVDVPARGRADGTPVVLVHGFPTCAWDWRHVVDRLAASRRVVAPDLPGYGASSKPDRDDDLDRQAAVVVELLTRLDIDEIDLVTHDMGDSVGGALLDRDLRSGDDGRRGVTVRRRVLANGSIYLGLAHLTSGQRLAERLPNRRLPVVATPLLGALYRAGVRRTFGRTPIAAEDLDALWALTALRGGHLLLPRRIRYLDGRRRHEERWTGAIERHPSPVHVVWGDADPVADVTMAHRFVRARPDATLTTLAGVGHFPMLEAPARFGAAVDMGLGRT